MPPEKKLQVKLLLLPWIFLRSTIRSGDACRPEISPALRESSAPSAHPCGGASAPFHAGPSVDRQTAASSGQADPMPANIFIIRPMLAPSSSCKFLIDVLQLAAEMLHRVPLA